MEKNVQKILTNTIKILFNYYIKCHFYVFYIYVNFVNFQMLIEQYNIYNERNGNIVLNTYLQFFIKIQLIRLIL